MSTRAWLAVAILLAVVIFVMAWFLFTTPAEAPTVNSAQGTTTNEATLPSPTSATTTPVTVTTPTPNSTVSHSFEVAGTAPNEWFFEAVFPIQVRDAKGDLISSSQAKAQGDWTQPGLVTFTAEVAIDESYQGPAKLILSKDNPSGLPQNADEVTIPIVVQ